MARDLPTESEAREILSRRRTRPMPRPAPPAGRTLAPLIKELDAKFGRGAGALEPRWREIVGDQLARVTRPQKLTKGQAGSGGTLELRVAGPAALLVQHQSADILKRVNLFLGEGAVEKLRIAQGPVKPLPVVAASTKGARRRIEPLDAAAEADLKQSVEAAPDALKAALTNLGRAVLSNETRHGRPRDREPRG
ncbi:MAG: DciA family protein [Caulobacteraceae bacterium]|nr:DciA family protein [Caulobacteraceae bacterium]